MTWVYQGRQDYADNGWHSNVMQGGWTTEADTWWRVWQICSNQRDKPPTSFCAQQATSCWQWQRLSSFAHEAVLPSSVQIHKSPAAFCAVCNPDVYEWRWSFGRPIVCAVYHQLQASALCTTAISVRCTLCRCHSPLFSTIDTASVHPKKNWHWYILMLSAEDWQQYKYHFEFTSKKPTKYSGAATSWASAVLTAVLGVQ